MNEKDEVWLKISFTDNYEVSSHGRVRRKDTKQLLNPSFQSTGNRLEIVYFRVKGKNVGKNLGYLVAEHFVPNPNNYKFIFYKNSDCYDNRASNIEWTKLRQYHHKPNYLNESGRTCSVCRRFKSWDEFYGADKYINSKMNTCITCCHNSYNERKEEVSKQGKIYRANNRDKIRVRDKTYRESDAIYSRFKNKLTIHESPMSDVEGRLLVKCTFCREYFTPTTEQANRRVYGLNNPDRPEGRLYCSDNCRENCPLFYAVLYPKGFLRKNKYEDARVKEWREMVLERDNYTCQECGDTENVVAHHIIPVIVDYTISADLDNGVTLCVSCHKIKHSEIDGCGYKELSELCHD